MDLADHQERLKANDNLKFSQEYEVNVGNIMSSVIQECAPGAHINCDFN